MKDHKHEVGNFTLNTAGISTVEFFWGLGLPLVLESTFLQLFLKELGASSFLISFVPGFFFIGQAFFGLVSAYRTRALTKKRRSVLLYHLYPAIFISGFGFFLLATSGFSKYTLPVFFISYGVFNFGIGMVLPVWQNYLVKLFSEKTVLPALSVMFIAQTAGRLISSFLLAGYFTDKEVTPESSTILFLLCGALFFFGSFGFLLTKEPETEDSAETRDAMGTGFFKYILNSIEIIIKDRNLLKFLFGDLELYAIITVLSFYANYAVQYHGISAAAAAGIFVGVYFLGQIISNVLLGSFNLLSLKNKCILSRFFSVPGIIILIFCTNIAGFLAASLLLGLARSIRSLIYAPAIKIISGKPDATSHFAAAPVLMLPLSLGISVLSGKMLDVLSYTGADSYRILFGVLAGLAALSLLFIIRTDFRSS